MKKNSIAAFLAVAVASAGFLSASNAFAISMAQADSLRTALSRVAVPEMPAKAAELISTAKTDERSDVAHVVVTAVVGQNPALAPAVVAAVAARTPEVSAVSAVAAALLQPSQIGPITKAAAQAAPDQVAGIVAAMCQQFPTRYNLIAVAASEGAPKSDKAILMAVAASMPALSAEIDRVVSASGSTLKTLTAVTETEQFVVKAASSAKTSSEQFLSANRATTSSELPRSTVVPSLTMPEGAPMVTLAPPSLGGPFQPVSPTPGTIDRDNTSIVDPGGSRDYSGG